MTLLDSRPVAFAANVTDLGRSVAERVAAYLEAAILDGRIQPGVWLREIDIAKQLGISRTPLRESFLLLVKKGLLEIVPRRGARVRTVSDDEWRHILSVRIALDGLAAQLAAKRRADGAAMDLSAIVRAQKVALQRKERSRFHDLGQELHAAIYRESGNPKLQDIYQALAVDGALHRLADLGRRGEMETTTKDHQKIVSAIESGEPEKARAAAEAHLRRALAQLDGALVIDRRRAASR